MPCPISPAPTTAIRSFAGVSTRQSPFAMSASTDGIGTSHNGPYPHVTVPYRIAVILQIERAFGRDTLERRGRGWLAIYRYMILNEHAVVQHRERARQHLPVRLRFWRVKDNVVSLPLARLAASVDERRAMP